MSTLTVERAAAIAYGVYALIDQTIDQSIARGDVLGSEGFFAVGEGTRFQGRSGGLYICKVLTGFGYIAEGVGTRKGEVLIATRGTELLADWLTDANVGLQRGPSGELVHAGFHETWKSLSADIREFLRGRNPTEIHCVGHSLGGALATLTADYLSSLRVGNIKLYTFGSPRVGSSAFVRGLDDRVGEQNVYRSFHSADPVPMIPLFPFFHVPAASSAYQLGGGSTGLINFGAHKMGLSYVPAVAGQSWDSLRRRDLSNDHKMNVQLWLEQVSANSSGMVMGSTWVLAMICKALAWLLEMAALLVCTGISAGMAASLTALDYLAMMLARGAHFSADISLHLKTIVTAIFRFLGRRAISGTALTVDFIRWVLGLLYQSLATTARRALSVLG